MGCFASLLPRPRPTRKREGLKLLDDYAEIFGAVGHDPVIVRCFPYLRAVLQTGHAVNAYDAGRFGASAEAYADALAALREAGQPLAALDILRRLLDLSAPGKSEQATALKSLVAGLFANALGLEPVPNGGEAATDTYTIRLPVSHEFADGTRTCCQRLDGVVGGSRCGAGAAGVSGRSLAGPGRALNWLNLPRTLAIEQYLGRLRDQAALEHPGKPSAIDGVPLRFCTSYINTSEMHGGAYRNGTVAEFTNSIR